MRDAKEKIRVVSEKRNSGPAVRLFEWLPGAVHNSYQFITDPLDGPNRLRIKQARFIRGIQQVHSLDEIGCAVAFGFLPPILAAALQSIPDLGILGNSARLLKQKVI